MTPQFDRPIPINTSLRNFGWLLKRRETSSTRNQLDITAHALTLRWIELPD